MVRRARKVDAMVDFLRQASGASRYTEIQFFTQTLETAAKGKGGTLGSMQSRLPWLTHLHPQADFAKASFAQDEIQWFETDGIDDQLMQIVGSNGRYGDLGLKNWSHFSHGGENSQAFEKLHREALSFHRRARYLARLRPPDSGPGALLHLFRLPLPHRRLFGEPPARAAQVLKSVSARS